MDTLILNGSDLSLEALYQVAFERRKVEIAPEALERAEKARQVLFDMAAEGYSTSPSPISACPIMERVVMSPSPIEPRRFTTGWIPRFKNS